MSTESEKKIEAALEGAKQLPEQIKHDAVEAVTGYYNTYHKRIKPLQDKLNAVVQPATESLSKVLFGLAEKVQHEAGSSMEKCRSLWASLTAYVENEIKMQAEKDNLPNPGNMIAVVPAWASLKSTITQMFVQGLDIFETRTVTGKDDVKTEERVFNNITDVRAVTSKRGAQDRRLADATATAPSIGAAMRTTAKLGGVLKAVSNTLAQMNEAEQDEAASILMEAHAKLQAIVQTRKDSERAERHAINKEVTGEALGTVVAANSRADAMRAGSRR